MTTRTFARGLALVFMSLMMGCGQSSTAPSTTTDTITTDPFDAGFPVGDDAQQQLTVAGSGGLITATLVSTTPPNISLGLGIGVRGTTCFLTTSVNAVAGTQVSLQADPGQYCVEVFDNGTLTQAVQFVATITHP